MPASMRASSSRSSASIDRAGIRSFEGRQVFVGFGRRRPLRALTRPSRPDRRLCAPVLEAHWPRSRAAHENAPRADVVFSFKGMFMGRERDARQDGWAGESASVSQKGVGQMRLFRFAVLLASIVAGSALAAAGASAASRVVGHVYVNDNTAGVNTIAAFDRHGDGTLTPIAGSPFAAGGAGTGHGIGSQGALADNW